MKHFLFGFAVVFWALFAGTAEAQMVGYPPGAFPAAAVNTGTTGAVSATMTPPNASEFVYACGFAVSFANGATAGTIGPVTVTGLFGGNQTYQIPPQTSTNYTLTINYTVCIPGSAPGQAIAVNTTADGNATAVDVQVWGYRQP